MISYMGSVGLEIHDVELFFHTLTGGECKEVPIDVFAEGCLAMKGVANGLDMQQQLHQTRMLYERMKQLIDKQNTFEKECREKLNRVLGVCKGVATDMRVCVQSNGLQSQST